MRGTRMLGIATVVCGMLFLVSSDIRAADAAALAHQEAVFQALMQYELGANNDTPQALENLVKATFGKPQEQKRMAARLAAVLSGQAPRGAKELACRHLAWIGTADEAPGLAALLADEQLSYPARLALESIPGPAADEALRQAVGKVKGKLLLGVINSVGQRRDEKAVELLKPLVASEDTALSEAAIRALTCIPSLHAKNALLLAFIAPPPGRLPVLAEAVLDVVDRDVAQGSTQLAFPLYFAVSQARVSTTLQRRALFSAIRSAETESLPAMDAVFAAEDRRGLDVGLWLVRKAFDPQVNTKIVQAAIATARNPRTSPDRAALILAALADRGDRAALTAVRELAKQGPLPVRAAAIAALSKLGDVSAMNMLLQLATGGGELAPAAGESLANMPGKEVDAALLAALAKADVKARPVVINLLGQRHSTSAAPALLKLAQDQDPATRAAAIKALAGTARPADLDALVALLVGAADAKEMDALGESIATICQAVTDKDSCTAKLAARFATAGVPAKLALLRTMSQIGGRTALDCVRKTMTDTNEETRAAATRVLCDWPAGEAAADLRQVAEKATDRKLKILALRGFIRLIAQSELGIAEKLSMAAEAMRLADRVDEKRLVLAALGNQRERRAMAALLPYLDDPQLKDEAASAVIAVGNRLLTSDRREVEKAAAKVLATVNNPGIKKRAEQLLARAKKQ